MIDFMIIGAPRCGTAWAANWLTTEYSFCLHDPLFERHYAELDEQTHEDERSNGIACTGIANFPDYVNAHHARKVILHRREEQVNDACAALGFPPVPQTLFTNLDAISGFHVPWTDLFHKPLPIHRYLFGERYFDARRHSLLIQLNVQRDLEAIHPNQAVTRRLIQEMSACVK